MKKNIYVLKKEELACISGGNFFPENMNYEEFTDSYYKRNNDNASYFNAYGAFRFHSRKITEEEEKKVFEARVEDGNYKDYEINSGSKVEFNDDGKVYIKNTNGKVKKEFDTKEEFEIFVADDMNKDAKYINGNSNSQVNNPNSSNNGGWVLLFGLGFVVSPFLRRVYKNKYKKMDDRQNQNENATAENGEDNTLLENSRRGYISSGNSFSLEICKSNLMETMVVGLGTILSIVGIGLIANDN